LTAADAVREQTVALAWLVELEFDEGTYRVWSGGPGVLTTLDGREWQGVRGLGAISQVESGSDVSAYAFTVGLRRAAEGVEVDAAAFAAAVNAERRRDVFGRAVTIYWQVLNLTTYRPENMPVTAALGEMSHIVSSRQGPEVTSIEIHCESLFGEGRKPPFGYYTDADQQALYPGDEGLQYIAANASRAIKWPRD
jgi:hypothetical protein